MKREIAVTKYLASCWAASSMPIQSKELKSAPVVVPGAGVEWSEELPEELPPPPPSWGLFEHALWGPCTAKTSEAVTAMCEVAGGSWCKNTGSAGRSASYNSSVFSTVSWHATRSDCDGPDGRCTESCRPPLPSPVPKAPRLSALTRNEGRMAASGSCSWPLTDPLGSLHSSRSAK